MPKEINPRLLELARKIYNPNLKMPKLEEIKQVSLKPADLEEIIDFCGVPLIKSDYQALKDTISFTKPKITPENYYQKSPKKIKIENKRITYLDLGNTGLSSLPDSIGNLSSLQRLSVYNNQLSSLPDSIGNLSSLKEFYVPNNKLSSLPDSIGNLSSLQRLSVYNNQLSSLPDSIGNLSSLKEFDVFNNKLSKKEIKKLDILKSRGVNVHE